MYGARIVVYFWYICKYIYTIAYVSLCKMSVNLCKVYVNLCIIIHNKLNMGLQQGFLGLSRL